MTMSDYTNADTVVFGGSFDPIHTGHLKVIHYIITSLNVKKLLLLPSKVSPFKVGQYSLNDGDRLKCITLALDDYEELYGKDERNKITIDRYEIDSNSDCSYTADTVFHYINDEGFASPLNFIIGTDILFSLSSWKNADYLRKNVHFIVVRRMSEHGDNDDIKQKLLESGFCLTYLNNPLYDYSSTKVKEGYTGLLSKRVEGYLKGRGKE